MTETHYYEKVNEQAGEDDVVVINTDGEEETGHNNKSLSAGIASGLIGLFLCGPIGALILGFGAAYATTQDGPVGDTARNVGDCAIKVGDKAKQMNEKHQIVDKSKKLASSTWEKAKKIDEKHKIIRHTKACVVFGYRSTKDFAQRHEIPKKVSGAVSGTCAWINRTVFNQPSKDDIGTEARENEASEHTQSLVL